MAKKRSKKQQQFTLQPWMFAALAVVVIAIVVGVILAAQSSEDEGSSSFTTISAQEAYDQTSTNDDAVFVDVRRPDEWQDYGYPVGATLLEMDNILAVTSGEVMGLPQDQPIYVICNSGNRSIEVSNHLIDLGYDEVYNVDGGFQAWLAAGLPTAPYN